MPDASQRIRVLIADDDAAFRNRSARALEQRGIEVLTRANTAPDSGASILCLSVRQG